MAASLAQTPASANGNGMLGNDSPNSELTATQRLRNLGHYQVQSETGVIVRRDLLIFSVEKGVNSTDRTWYSI